LGEEEKLHNPANPDPMGSVCNSTIIGVGLGGTKGNDRNLGLQRGWEGATLPLFIIPGNLATFSTDRQQHKFKKNIPIRLKKEMSQNNSLFQEEGTHWGRESCNSS
jgi:hypothetical protein